MKRLHIHLSVKALDPSISFYSKLFGAEPTVQKDDYAKWMLDDPLVNFAVSTRGGKGQLEHFGIQVDSESELEDIRAHLGKEKMSLYDEGETECCYMQSDKSWIQDPDAFPWELYRSMSEVKYFHSDEDTTAKSGCCTPSAGCC